MALNKDGLDPSKPVDFATMKRIQREHSERKAEDAKPKSAERKDKEVRKSNRNSDESAS